MLVDEKMLAGEVAGVVQRLTELANGLASDGLLHASGIVLGGAQAVRMLYTQLHPPTVREPPLGEE